MAKSKDGSIFLVHLNAGLAEDKSGRWPRLVKAKGEAGARAFIADRLLEVFKASPAEVYRYAQAGKELEDATKLPPAPVPVQNVKPRAA